MSNVVIKHADVFQIFTFLSVPYDMVGASNAVRECPNYIAYFCEHCDAGSFL